MKLPEIAVKNHQFTIVLFMLLFIFGITSYLTMPRSEDPQIVPNGISVIVVYPGTIPADMEELIADPVEEKLNELDNIKQIDTSINSGIVFIQIKFFAGTDMDEAYSEALQKVNNIKNELPDDLYSIDVIRWRMSDFIVMLQLGLISEKKSYAELDDELEILKKDLENVYGVKKVKKWAIPERKVYIDIDQEKLSKTSITIEQISKILQGNNINIPAGSIDAGLSRFFIQTSGSFKDLNEIRNSVIGSYQGRILYLKDIAKIHLEPEKSTYFARINKKRAVFLTVNQKEGTNVFEVMRGINKKIEKFKKTLDDHEKLYYVFNQAESVRMRLSGFFNNLFQGLIVVGLIILLAVGIRASSVVMIVIPLSIFINFGFLDISGYGIEQMSIAGLVIALGLLVDNAIVVIENVTRFSQLGYGAKEAAFKGTSQVGWAVVSATATTILAFLPIILMQNEAGQFIRSMPLTVVFTLGISLIIALTLTPYLASKYVVNSKRKTKKSRFKKTLEKFIDKIYKPVLDFSVNNPKRMVFGALILLLLSMLLFQFIGVSFFPMAEKPQFAINISTSDNSGIKKTDKAAKYVESILLNDDRVKTVAANIGRGNPQFHFNIESRRKDQTYCQIYVEMKKNDLEIRQNLIQKLREKFKTYADAKIEVQEIEMGEKVEAPIAIKILGDEMGVLKKLSEEVENMFNLTDGSVNVKNPLADSKMDLRIKINKDKANLLGIQIAQIDKTVRAAVSGLDISQFRDKNGKEYNMVLRMNFSENIQINDLDKIYITSVTGKRIPLKEVATIEFERSPKYIQHFDFQRCATITSDVKPGFNIENVTNEILDKVRRINLPEGYSYHVAGSQQARQSTFGGMGKAVIIALIGIFAVLVLQFKSYSQPFIVFSAIPLAFVGSLIALFLTGYTFSFTAFIGLTALLGIVVNNSIILVDYTNQLRRIDGFSIKDALMKAGETRFTPIILTTATTIGGLLPLTLRGGSLWGPMGWTVIGGLTTSTVLTLLIVPALYRVYVKEAGSKKQKGRSEK